MIAIDIAISELQELELLPPYSLTKIQRNIMKYTLIPVFFAVVVFNLIVVSNIAINTPFLIISIIVGIFLVIIAWKEAKKQKKKQQLIIKGKLKTQKTGE